MFWRKTLLEAVFWYFMTIIIFSSEILRSTYLYKQCFLFAMFVNEEYSSIYAKLHDFIKECTKCICQWKANILKLLTLRILNEFTVVGSEVAVMQMDRLNAKQFSTSEKVPMFDIV